MAIVLLEGFDFYTAAQATSRGWSGTIPGSGAAMISGRYGGQGARTGASGGGNIYKNLPGTYTELYTGFACRSTAPTANSTQVFSWRNGTTNTLRFGYAASSVFQLYNSVPSTLVSTTQTISSSIWRYIEVYLLINGASGSVEVHVDGVLAAGPTTVNIGSSGITNVGFGFGNGQNTDIDDVWVADTTTPGVHGFIGDTRIETLYPTSEGNTTLWTPISGTDNALMVDDPTSFDSDTTYNFSGTLNDYDTYVTGNLATASGIVHGLQTVIGARKDGPQSVRQVAPVIRHGGTDYTGSTGPALASGYAHADTIYNQTPASADWTIADVNAAEFGVKLVT